MEFEYGHFLKVDEGVEGSSAVVSRLLAVFFTSIVISSL